jgi:hypothetical protein
MSAAPSSPRSTPTASRRTRTCAVSGPSVAMTTAAQRRVRATANWNVNGTGSRPGVPGSTQPSPRSALTSFLAAHAEWLAGFDGDYAAHELGHLAYRLEQVVRQTTPARVKRIAPCPEKDCTGTLEAVVRKEDDLLPSHVYCSADRAHTWAPEEWRALRRRLETLLDAAG